MNNPRTISAAKKRTSRHQINEVIFDDDARRDFLTGFHKRKVAKAEAARSKAQEREKQSRLEARREQRRILREQAIENAKKVENAYASIYGQRDGESDNDDEQLGIASFPKDKGKQRDDEYEDEEVLATVTVVEDFDPDAIRHGSPKPPPTSLSLPQPPPSKKLIPKLEAAPLPKKPKVQKIRYQTKEARKTERLKQFTRRTEKAERARGKATHKTSYKKKQGNPKR